MEDPPLELADLKKYADIFNVADPEEMALFDEHLINDLTAATPNHQAQQSTAPSLQKG